MTVRQLVPGSSTRCSPGVATLGWSTAGCGREDLHLEVVQQDSTDVPAAAVRRTGHDQLLIAALPEAVVVRVRPAHGGVFPDGTSVSGELSLQGGDQYVLPRADVSGTSSTVLLSLAPARGLWALSVPSDVIVVSKGAGPSQVRADRDNRLDPQTSGQRTPGVLASEDRVEQDGDLVQRAAYAARRCTDGVRVERTSRPEWQVAVDRSASLMPFVRSGGAQSLLELLAGVNTVCGSTPEVQVWELGRVPRRIRPPMTDANAGSYWATSLGSRASTDGTVVSPLLRATATAPSSRIVVVLTDGVPSDLEDATQVLRDARAAGSQVRWHLLVLGRGPDDPAVRLEPWRNELLPLQPLVDQHLLTLTSVAPGQGEDWLARHLADSGNLEALVGTLPLLPAPS